MRDSRYLKSWLKFDTSVTDDYKSLSWTATGNPTISSTNAKSGNALQLDGSQYLSSGEFELGGQDFTIDGWFYIDSTSPGYARLFSIVNPTTGYMMVTVRASSNNDRRLEFWYNSSPTQAGNNGNTYTCPAGTYTNNLIHVALTYRHKKSGVSGETFRLYVNGVQRAINGTGAISIPRGTFRIDVGNNAINTAQGVIGSVDELCVNDGVELWAGTFTPPTLDYYQTLDIPFSTNLFVRNPLLEWRYENPGVASLLTTANGGTVTDEYRVKAVTGTAFYQPDRTACFGIAATNEIWLRCDIWMPFFNSNYRVRVYSDDGSGVNGWSSTIIGSSYSYSLWHNDTRQNSENTMQTSERYSLWLHMKSGTTDGLVEYRIINESIGSNDFYDSYTGNVNAGNDFANVYIQMDGGDNILASNVVIANYPVDINEGWTCNNYDTDLTIENSIPTTVNFDTVVEISKTVEATFDTEIIRYVTAEVHFDTVAEIAKTVEATFDTVISTPHQISGQTSTGLQGLTISLQEQQLTDEVSFVVADDIDILDAVIFNAWDYNLFCRVEQTSKKGIMQTCKCTVDIDEILYQQMAYTIPANAFEWTYEYNQAYNEYVSTTGDDEIQKKPSAPASAHITSIAGCLGKNVSLQFDDWISTMSTEVKSGTNYAGLIEDLFGWTSRLPHLMINCFIRGNTIYAVQRGYEANTVVLDNQKLTVHTVSKKLMRTTWGTDPDSNTDVEPLYDTWSSDQLTPFPYQEDEPIPSGGGASVNSDNLVEETVVVHGDERVVTTYTYQDMGNGRKFLIEEVSNTYIGGSLADHVVTTHKPVSYGQAQVYSMDDESVLGTVVSPSNFDERVTPYQYQQVLSGGYSEAFAGGGYDEYGNYYTAVTQNGERYLVTGHDPHKAQIGQRTRLNAYALLDTSFPVDGYDKLNYLTQQIKWLDRRTEECISLDLYDYPHLIDFNDKISWHGHIYYLRSNTAVRSETIVNKQTLEFVRWY